MRSERFKSLGRPPLKGHFFQRSTALYKSYLKNKGLAVDKERIYMRRAFIVGTVAGIVWLIGIAWLLIHWLG